MKDNIRTTIGTVRRICRRWRTANASLKARSCSVVCCISDTLSCAAPLREDGIPKDAFHTGDSLPLSHYPESAALLEAQARHVLRKGGSLQGPDPLRLRGGDDPLQKRSPDPSPARRFPHVQ